VLRRAFLAFALILLWDWANIPPLEDRAVSAQQQCQDFASVTATGAANTGVTASITGKPGVFIYPIYIEATVIANAAVTGAAGPAGTLNTTGFLNNITFMYDNSSLTIGQIKDITRLVLPLGSIRTSATNTNFTVANNAGGQSTMTLRINVIACYAP
jgi:hypothetical protein